jgi:hypothetical protein
MSTGLDLAALKAKAKLTNRYVKQIQRLQDEKVAPGCIEEAVKAATENLLTAKTSSLIIYGEPQSGKTEMMICLTAKLLDDGHPVIVHLMNDSVDLLTQNLKRFKHSGLAPAARSLSELLQSSDTANAQELVVFCKKNTHDLTKLIDWLGGKHKVLVIDDEADYATPNAKINQDKKTKINDLIGQLIGNDGFYIGVTATPARLDLNKTFDNNSENWVYFPPHSKYTGQNDFFPLDGEVSYRLKLFDQGASETEARDAFVRFLLTAAYLNCYENGPEENYTMLVHTSGRKQDHTADRLIVEESVQALVNTEGEEFAKLATQVHNVALQLYPQADAGLLTDYVVMNASRVTLTVLNSERDRAAAGESATDPSSPFTVIIGGNIISRGVTFPNLLSMYFTRNVQNRLQQDTYIQRARMFGARGKYLKHFELTIPSQLYVDWHRCFVFHRLALATIKSKLGSPVWLGDTRISVAASSSINRATVALNKGEMAFDVFDYSDTLDTIVKEAPKSVDTLAKLQKAIGNDALPTFLIQYIQTVSHGDPEQLAIHTSSSIANSADANQEMISREKGFMGKSQLEVTKFSNAIHHLKIFRNASGKARVFYKMSGNIQFIQNLQKSSN